MAYYNHSMPSFNERYGPWALVTGASSGIGAEFARQLARQRLNLVLVARRVERLEALAAELRSAYSVEVVVVPADLAREDFLPGLIDATQGREIGLLVNNAGFSNTGVFVRNDIARELELFYVNCRAPLLLTHHFAQEMVARERGGIVVVSSVAGFAPIPRWTNYAASKAYGRFLGTGLWYELRQHGVDVLTLCPGGTRTEFQATAGIGATGAMAVEPVVRLALESIGRRPVAIPGRFNRLAAVLARTLPTWLVSRAAGAAIRGLQRTLSRR